MYMCVCVYAIHAITIHEKRSYDFLRRIRRSAWQSLKGGKGIGNKITISKLKKNHD